MPSMAAASGGPPPATQADAKSARSGASHVAALQRQLQQSEGATCGSGGQCGGPAPALVPAAVSLAPGAAPGAAGSMPTSPPRQPAGKPPVTEQYDLSLARRDLQELLSLPKPPATEKSALPPLQSQLDNVSQHARLSDNDRLAQQLQQTQRISLPSSEQLQQWQRLTAADANSALQPAGAGSGEGDMWRPPLRRLSRHQWAHLMLLSLLALPLRLGLDLVVRRRLVPLFNSRPHSPPIPENKKFPVRAAILLSRTGWIE